MTRRVVLAGTAAAALLLAVPCLAVPPRRRGRDGGLGDGGRPGRPDLRGIPPPEGADQRVVTDGPPVSGEDGALRDLHAALARLSERLDELGRRLLSSPAPEPASP